jgi:RNA polymerase sigma-70 factor (ECF subfamily)
LFFPPQPPNVSDKISQVDSAPNEPPDIARLTSSMAKGDEAAYRQFYELYFNRLLRYLLVVTSGAEAAAREAMQLTLVRIVRHIKPFNSEEAFWSWLTVLARSSIVDEARKRTRYQALLERFFESEQLNTPTHREADSRLLLLLEQELGELAADDLALVERRYLDGESLKEIAQAVGATDRAVESRLLRIRRHLKDRILLELKNEERA